MQSKQDLNAFRFKEEDETAPLKSKEPKIDVFTIKLPPRQEKKYSDEEIFNCGFLRRLVLVKLAIAKESLGQMKAAFVKEDISVSERPKMMAQLSYHALQLLDKQDMNPKVLPICSYLLGEYQNNHETTNQLIEPVPCLLKMASAILDEGRPAKTA